MIDAQRVDFVAVPTQDRERAAKFYGETRGITRNPNSSDMWIEFETGNLTIALLPHEFTGRSEFVPSSGPIAPARRRRERRPRQKLEGAGVEFQTDTIDSGVCFPSRPLRIPTGTA